MSDTHVATEAEDIKPSAASEEVTGVGSEGAWRVKVYALNGKGDWDDRGTGFISCKFSEQLGSTAIIVSGEADGKELLLSKVVDEDVYQRQGDNIITWCDVTQEDLALSFQENEGCLLIWNQLMEVQGRFFSGYQQQPQQSEGAMPASLPDPKMDNLHEIQETLAAACSSGPQVKEVLSNFVANGEGEYITKLLHVFEDCEDLEDMENLRRLCAVFKAIVCLNDRSLLELLLSNKFFVPVAGAFEYDPELKSRAHHRTFLTETVKFKQLLPIEDLSIVGRIHQNFRVCFLKDVLLRPMMDDSVVGTLNNITVCNNAAIVSALHKDSDYIRRVFSVFKEPNLSKERRLHVLQFVRELFSMAKSIPPGARDEFYRYLWNEVPFFEALVPVLADPDAVVAERTACMEVILDSLNQDASLLRLYTIKRGSHPPLPAKMQSGSSGTGMNGGNFGLPLVTQRTGTMSISGASGNGSLLDGMGAPPGSLANGVGGSVAASPEESQSLLFRVIQRLTSDTDTGVVVLAAEICRLCLDTTDPSESQLEKASADKDAFLEAFYKHYIQWLIQPFWEISEGQQAPEATDTASKPASVKDSSSIDKSSNSIEGESNSPKISSVGSGAAASEVVAAGRGGSEGARDDLSFKSSLVHICDLMSFCVKSHTYRMKYFVLRNKVVGTVLQTLGRRDKFLQLASIRFFRACVGIKDEFYNRYIVKSNLMAPLLSLLCENAGRDNLITSAILELLDFLRTDNVKSLIENVVEKFEQELQQAGRTAIFQALNTKYEQNREYLEGKDREVAGQGGASAPTRAQQGRKRLQEEDEDEAYFNESDDDDEGPQPASGIKELEIEPPPPPLRLVPYDEDDDDDMVFGPQPRQPSPSSHAVDGNGNNCNNSSAPHRPVPRGLKAASGGSLAGQKLVLGPIIGDKSMISAPVGAERPVTNIQPIESIATSTRRELVASPRPASPVAGGSAKRQRL